MLSKPQYGWSRLTIGDFNIDVSYLTSVARDCLEAFLHYRPWRPSSIRFDAESDGEVYLTLTPYSTFVIGSSWMPEDSAECGLREYNVKADDLLKELCSDIEKNIKEWAMWDVFEIKKTKFWIETIKNWIWFTIALIIVKSQYKHREKKHRKRLEHFKKQIAKNKK